MEKSNTLSSHRNLGLEGVRRCYCTVVYWDFQGLLQSAKRLSLMVHQTTEVPVLCCNDKEKKKK